MMKQDVNNGESTMSDLISRQEALKALKETYPTVWTESDYELGQENQWSSDELAILTVPSAEPKKGKWKLHKSRALWICTNCKDTSLVTSRFCPNCGAKMSRILTDSESEDKE